MDEQTGVKVGSVPDVNDGAAKPVVTDGSNAPVAVPDASANNGSSTGTPAWMAQLPSDLKGNENLKQYATLGEAVRSLMGTKAEPGAEVQKEEVKVRYENFGKKLIQDFDPFGDMSQGLAAYLEEKGMKQEDAEAFFDTFNDISEKAKQSMIEKGKSYCTDAVKKRWGNDYERKRALMAKGYQALGDHDGSLQKALDQSGVSLSPDVWEILARVGSLVGEDTGSPVKGTGGASSGLYTGGVPVDYSKPSI